MSGIPNTPERQAAVQSVLNAPANTGVGSAAAQPTGGPDDVTINVRGQVFGGWQDVRISRCIDRMPNDFEIGATEISPTQPGGFFCVPGDEISLMIGGDLVLTGYIDRYAPTITPDSHDIRITGRSKSEDLVDCNLIDVVGHQDAGGAINDLATRLAALFGITIKNQMTSTPKPLAQFNMMLTDTPFSVLDRATRYLGVIMYDDPDGSVVLANLSDTRAGSDLVLGLNIESAQCEFSMDQRYSDYYAFRQPYWNTMDHAIDEQNSISHFTDSSVPRHRPKTIVSQVYDQNAQAFADQEAKWQCGRRYGRSWSARIIVSTWRDGTGLLWQPNTLIGLDLPQLGIKPGISPGITWCVGMVTYHRGEGGTTAELLVMPQEAFMPEPAIFNPFPTPELNNPGTGAGNTPATPPAGGANPAPAEGTRGFAGVPGQAGTPSGPPAVRGPNPGV